MSNSNRRQFFGQVAAGALLLGCTRSRSKAGGDARLATRATTTAPAPISRPTPKANVGVGWSRTYRKAVDAALAVVGGLAFVKRGDTVLLKVNTNSGDPYPYSTNPELIEYLGGQLRDRGAKVVVGDRSFWGDGDTAGNLRRNGIAAAAAKISARLVPFEDDGVRWVKIDRALPNWRGDIHLPRVAVEADHIINLPCVKTHFITNCTLSLKNVLGLVKAGDRRRPGNLDTHTQAAIYKQIAQINQAIRPRLNILDGYRALITGGPTPGSGARPTFATPRLIVASTDRIATDAVGIALLRAASPKSERVTQMKTWRNPMITAAVDAGLGIRSSSDLVVAGPTVRNLDAITTLART